MGRKTTVLTAIACGMTVALGACKRKSDSSMDSTSAMMEKTDSVGGAMTPATPAPAPTPAPAMTDAAIVARVTAANQGEIDAGKMASDKATNADVKAFAHMMVVDHGKMLSDGAALAKRANITPDMAAADSIMAANKMTADKLGAAAKGSAFDMAYVNAQVEGHEATLQMLKDAEGVAQNPDLKKMLGDAQKPVSQHLDRIKDIQGKMK